MLVNQKNQLMIIRIVLFLALGYICLTVMAFFLQRKMLYFPDRTKPHPDQLKTMGIAFWPDGGADYKGFVAAQPLKKAKGTIIVFHGNAGAAWHRNYYVNALTPMGYHVILAEYPGYGGRSGSPSEATFLNDAHETIRKAYESFGGPLFLWGESLGCGVVAGAVAPSSVPVAGVVLITPWDSLPNLAQSIYWYLPVRMLLHDRFDNGTNLRAFKGPIAVAMAGLDTIIPNKHTLHLYEQLPPLKKLWRFDHAGHNDWPTGPEEQWWGEVIRFITSERSEN